MFASRQVAVAAAALARAGRYSLHAEGPAIDHSEIKCLVAGKYRKMPAKFSPADVAQPRVYFRPEGVPSWYYVEMKPEDAAGPRRRAAEADEEAGREAHRVLRRGGQQGLRQRAHARVRADRGGEGQECRPGSRGPALLEEPADRRLSVAARGLRARRRRGAAGRALVVVGGGAAVAGGVILATKDDEPAGVDHGHAASTTTLPSRPRPPPPCLRAGWIVACQADCARGRARSR